MSFGISRIELEDGPATRNAFGEALVEAGKTDDRICVVDGDVHNSTMTGDFMDEFPERSFNVGIAESNLVGIAAGLAAAGKVPVAASFATFLLSNAFDQIRMSVAFPNLNVKLVGTHAGISIGEDGPSQMAIEDISQATSFPGMTVIVPADGPSTKAATRAMLERVGPTYMRCGRPAVPLVYSSEADFQLGKATKLRDGDEVTIIANGIMVAMALDAAEGLRSDGVEARVLDMHTVKPLDVDAIVAAANETKGIVVAEEHLCYGGLGSAVSMVVSEQRPSKMAFVNIGDTYATSGKPDELLAQFGLTPGAIEDAAHRVLKD